VRLDCPSGRGWNAFWIETWRTLPTLAGYYEFPRDASGAVFYRGLRGPEYVRALRNLAIARGVRSLDHSPALELLLRSDGSVAGARGVQRQAGNQAWTVRAAGTVLATGGCAFLSPLLGSRNNTGDGYLMAVEAGAEFSGMEFCSQHTIAAAGTSQTRSASYSFATFYDASGRELDSLRGLGEFRGLASALLEGPDYCTLARMPSDLRAALHRIQPAFQLPFERQGIDPFTDRFPVTLHGEGTIRGVGGLRIVNEDCETSVSGLFAVGDAATRAGGRRDIRRGQSEFRLGADFGRESETSDCSFSPARRATNCRGCPTRGRGGPARCKGRRRD